MTPEQKKIYKQIALILWDDWDPIGLNDEKSSSNEYDDYIPVFFRMIYNKATIYEISDKLTHISTETIGVEENRKLDLEIAEKLYELEKYI